MCLNNSNWIIKKVVLGHCRGAWEKPLLSRAKLLMNWDSHFRDYMSSCFTHIRGKTISLSCFIWNRQDSHICAKGNVINWRGSVSLLQRSSGMQLHCSSEIPEKKRTRLHWKLDMQWLTQRRNMWIKSLLDSWSCWMTYEKLWSKQLLRFKIVK